MDPTDETPEAIDLSIRDAVLRVFSCWEYVKLVQFRMNVINHQSTPTYIPKANWYESSHPKKAKNPKKIARSTRMELGTCAIITQMAEAAPEPGEKKNARNVGNVWS